MLLGVWVGLVLALGLIALYLLRASLFVLPPDALRLPGLQRACQVAFDRFGVPHVQAESLRDAFFVQGFLHARERFFQMELARRAAAGRLAEVLGPKAVPLDVRFRRWGLWEAARRQRQLLEGEAEAVVAAYAAGVNAALASLPPWRLAPECLFLGCQVEPWVPEDTLAVGLLLQSDLTWAAGEELRRARELAGLGRARATRLWGWSDEQADLWIPPTPLPRPERPLPSLPTFSAVGSNNWVVVGSRSASGGPLLANDPHVGVANPATWYEIHLQAPEFAVAGASVPGTPGVLIGHNGHVAWGLTMAMLDDQDLFRLTLDREGRRERFGDSWLPLQVLEQELRVRGEKAPRRLTVKRSLHGPVIREGEGEVLALAWSALQARSPVGCFLRLAQAKSAEEAMASFSSCESPAMNLVVADRQGHVGWQVTGRVPRRGRGAGRLPAPGDDPAWAWQGLEPFEANPRLFDPPAGLLATANHDPFAEGDFPPPGFPGEFAGPERVRTIRRALASRQDWDVAGFLSLQMDVHNPQAAALLAALRPMLQQLAHPAAQRLLAWDGRMSAESEEALLWAEFLRALIRRVGGDEGKATGLDRSPLSAAAMLRLALGQLDVAWWDDVTTPEQEQPQEMVARALAEAAERAAGKSWGEAHQVLFAHPLGSVPLLGWLFNAGPFPVGGAGPCLNATAYRASGEDFNVVALPSLRFVADLSIWDNSRMVLPLGQSGHPLSRHARDQLPLWLAGQAHAMPFSPQAVAKAKVRVTTFLPR